MKQPKLPMLEEEKALEVETLSRQGLAAMR